jgi:hypothetical protein
LTKARSTLAGAEPSSDGRATAVPELAERSRPTEDEIRLCAYRKWVSAGRPMSDGVAFWLEAERELVNQR